jgi:hypothetical protein
MYRFIFEIVTVLYRLKICVADFTLTSLLPGSQTEYTGLESVIKEN